MIAKEGGNLDPDLCGKPGKERNRQRLSGNPNIVFGGRHVVHDATLVMVGMQVTR
jgi:hypothetical protein